VHLALSTQQYILYFKEFLDRFLDQRKQNTPIFSGLLLSFEKRCRHAKWNNHPILTIHSNFLSYLNSDIRKTNVLISVSEYSKATVCELKNGEVLFSGFSPGFVRSGAAASSTIRHYSWICERY
jgi:hypothetical protein